MTRNKTLFYTAITVLALAGILFYRSGDKKEKKIFREVSPETGYIQTSITSTGTVKPENRLELKPTVAGRIENILVKEGQDVKNGEVLAWLSSTERAALLDAAIAYGEEAVKYWKEVYKPTPLISPIDGEVIVSKDQPGQTVTTSDVVMVLSDHLIVQAQVDETDIGRVKLGQDALISLDAYPEIKVKGKVKHIYYESETVNNVTIYKVDVITDTVPQVFRSGMNATVEIVEERKENALLLPHDVLKNDDKGEYVMVKEEGKKGPSRRMVKTGLRDDKKYEIVSGISKDDIVLTESEGYKLPTKSVTGKNPFMPTPPADKKKSR